MDIDGQETERFDIRLAPNPAATSSYWMLTNEYMVDKFKYAKELQPYKGMGLCSECGRLATSPDGRDVVVPGKWHGKFPKKKATEEQLKKVGYKNLIR